MVPRTNQIVLRKTVVNRSGSFDLSHVFWMVRYVACRIFLRSSCLHDIRCSKVPLFTPHHSHTSVPRLHLYQLWPTGSHRNIILLVRIMWFISWDALVLPIDVQLILSKTLSSISGQCLTYSIMVGEVVKYSTLFLKCIVINNQSSI